MMTTNKELIRRLKHERAELKYKIKKLAKFKKSKAWYKIGADQQTLLICQVAVMRCYRNILTARINSIKGDTNE